jgi:predicted ATPase/DNA-binding SARP family transcriptional activator/Tfp pilus assembly protein PilF
MPRVRTRAAEWLLALLVLRQERTLDRSWLAGTLWPDSGESQALQNLRHALLSLRKSLGPEERRIQSPTRDTLTLDLDGVETDILRFDRAIRQGDEAALRLAVEVYTGPLLEGCLEEWVFLERESRQEMCLNALETLADAAAKQQDYANALTLLRRAVGMDPLRNTTVCGLMRVLAASGDMPAALMAYRDYRLRLRKEMNLEPDAETVRLYQEIRDAVREGGRLAGIGYQTPEPRSPAFSLPHSLTTLIGREREAGEIANAVAVSRLVTLVGAGGVGKTRLAIEVAREVGSRFEEGAAFVALASLSDPTLLPAFVASALGLREAATPEPEFLLNALMGWLSTHPLLLVLDNCEHLIEATAALAQSLLQRCPHLHILATSQQRLALTGEVVWQVPPLSAPDPESLSREDRPVEAVLQYPAAQLFVERAGMARQGFQLASPEAALATARICRYLDGIPLAIELAAARIGLLNVGQIAARLDDRFRLLTGGSRAVLTRHQTLRSLIDWSYDLLTEAERTLLRHLSVFMGGWTLEAVEAIGKDEGGRRKDEGDTVAHPSSPLLHPSGREVFDLLASLLDKSLVLAEDQETGPRYTMLETVRQYAGEKLRESGEEAEARKRHSLFYLEMAEESATALVGAAPEAALALLETEVDNFRAALTWAQTEPSDIYLRLAAALWPFWEIHGYLSEGRTHLRAALQRPDQPHSPTRLRALLGATTLAVAQYDMEEALRFGHECLERFREQEDVRGMAEALLCLGEAYLENQDHDRAVVLVTEGLERSRQSTWSKGMVYALILLGRLARWRYEWRQALSFYEQGLALAETLGDSRLIASASYMLSVVAMDLRDDALARRSLTRSLEIYHRLGDRQGVSRSLGTLGQLERRGDLKQAMAYTLESIATSRELGNRADQAHGLHQAGSIYYQQGDYEKARQNYAAALNLFTQVGTGIGITYTSNSLGSALFHLGRPSEAQRLHREALSIYRRHPGERGVVWTLERFVVVEALHGDAETAARLIGAASAGRERLETPMAPWDQADWDQAVASLREALGEAAFETLRAQGRAMTLEQAVAQVLTPA